MQSRCDGWRVRDCVDDVEMDVPKALKQKGDAARESVREREGERRS